MKCFIISLVVISFAAIALEVNGQYCDPPAYKSGPYTGITNVTLGWLNNTTAFDDGVTYYSSSPSPELRVDSPYVVSIKTVDQRGLGQNSRVWIDWNQDNDFDDADEEVAFWNGHSAGAVTMEFTVPADAKGGTTRMRVYCDMDSAGQITPNPCGYLNQPAHPVGQRGEVEDYNVDITWAVGVSEQGKYSKPIDPYLYFNEHLIINYLVQRDGYIRIEMFNLLGQKIKTLVNTSQSAGFYQININKNELSYSAMNTYFVKFIIEKSSVTRKFVWLAQ